MTQILTLPDEEPRRVVKIARAAVMLDMSERTVRRLCDAGKLESTGHGRLRRVFVTSIDDYLAHGRAA